MSALLRLRAPLPAGPGVAQAAQRDSARKCLFPRPAFRSGETRVGSATGLGGARPCEG